MADQRTPFPIIPRVINGDMNRWAADLTRALEQLVEAIRNPGEGRQTALTITNLPVGDTGLETGALFRQPGSNSVLIVDGHIAYPVALTGTTALGTVTVTT